MGIRRKVTAVSGLVHGPNWWVVRTGGLLATVELTVSTPRSTQSRPGVMSMAHVSMP